MPDVPPITESGKPTGFRAAPSIIRHARRTRRLAKPMLWRIAFRLRLADPDKIVGSYQRTRLGVTETVYVTRRTDKVAAAYIVPPGEWPQDEADAAIRRGQELAEEHGW